MSEPLAISLFSGTDDKLNAAAVLVAGAAALGRPVHVFLQYWALDAFRRDRIEADHGLAPEAGPEGEAAVERLRTLGAVSWSETLRSAKEIGEVDIQACSLSMDLLDITEADLDREFFLDNVLGLEKASLRQIVQILRQTYSARIGVEFMHIQDPDQKAWIQERIEGGRNHTDFTVNGKKAAAFKGKRLKKRSFAQTASSLWCSPLMVTEPRSPAKPATKS